MNNMIHEECGVLGIFKKGAGPLMRMAYDGLFALQHRGQESCGIVVNDDGLFYAHKDLGLVGDVFTKDILNKMPSGNMAVGHVRYGTTGAVSRANCQPIMVNHQKGKLAIAHNGNLSNAWELRNALEMRGAIFHGTSDTEIIAYLITQERLRCRDIETAVAAAAGRLEGAFSLVVMSAAKMIAVRDPHGFRPLCYGMRPDHTYVIASESCALESVGARFIRDVAPGELIVWDNDGIRCQVLPGSDIRRSRCIFEYIYFARPDSVIDGISVHEARKQAGRILAETAPAEADLVIGVPDSGLDAALGYSAASRIPYGIGLIKNKYIGRTFIVPGQDERMNAVHLKLNPVKNAVNGKRIILIDDSIVRGTTSGQIVSMLRAAGAKEIHMRISSPPFLHPCYYGTDIDSEDHLIASHHTVDQIAEIIGADSLAYLPVDRLHQLSGTREICDACFSGNYPTKKPVHSSKERFDRRLSERYNKE